MSSFKVKDDHPLNSIKKIRYILSGLEIDLQEQWAEQCVQGLYSLRLFSREIDVGVNGKGTSKEFALASAYGEFMERLQNGVFLNRNTSFIISPDEKKIDISLVRSNKYLKDFFECLCIGFSFDDFLHNLIRTENNFDDQILCLPYHDLKESENIYIPRLLLHYIGTNGMCAGNSRNEALVQGISEIFERYCHKQIISNCINVPYLTLNDIETISERSHKQIIEIESLGYNIQIKDCSLNTGFPVLGIAIIDKKNQKYAVSLGAHPCVDIALERCLTEIFQGMSLSTLFNKYTYRPSVQISAPENLESILINSIGHYHSSFFLEMNHSTCLDEFNNLEFVNNNDAFNFCLNILNRLNKKLLIRNNSFLGFHSYSIIIPTMSEVFLKDKKLLNIQTKRYLNKKIGDTKRISDEDIEILIYYLFDKIKYRIYKASDLKKLLPKRFCTKLENKENNIYYIILYSLFKLHKWDQCIEYGMKILNILSEYDVFIQLIIDYSYFKKENKASEDEFWGMCLNFYEKDSIANFKDLIDNFDVYYYSMVICYRSVEKMTKAERLIYERKNRFMQWNNIDE